MARPCATSSSWIVRPAGTGLGCFTVRKRRRGYPRRRTSFRRHLDRQTTLRPTGVDSREKVPVLVTPLKKMQLATEGVFPGKISILFSVLFICRVIKHSADFSVSRRHSLFLCWGSGLNRCLMKSGSHNQDRAGSDQLDRYEP